MPENKRGMRFISKGESKAGNQVYLCQCPRCGKIVEMYASHYYRGSSSCHCLDSKHNRLYRIWINMKTRCYNTNTPNYIGYGAKGIVICDEWRNDFIAFESWALSNGYRDDLTIDRIDYSGNYEPSNCRWATMKEQADNKSNNVNITINGITMNFKNWCKQYNLNYKAEHSYYDRHGIEMWIERIHQLEVEQRVNTMPSETSLEALRSAFGHEEDMEDDE